MTSADRECDINANVLAELLVVQGVQHVLPSQERAAEFVTHALLSVPCCEQCNICYRKFGVPLGNLDSDECANCGVVDPEQDVGATCPLAHSDDIRVFPLETGSSHIGQLVMRINSVDTFASYETSLLNFANTVAVATEYRTQRRQVTAVNEELEQQRAEVQRIADERYEALQELNEARDQLVRQTKLATIGQLIGSIAHEVRNPLGVIRNAAYLLRRVADRGGPSSHSGNIDNEKMQTYLDIIDMETDSANHVIQDMLHMVRENKPSTMSFDLAVLIREEFRKREQANCRPFKLVCKTEPFVVVADEGQIRQVLSNLLLNSAQATEGEGHIEVTLERDGDNVLIFVRDDGPGIPDEDRERLFEPLFTTKAKGTGLGLVICRQIVERHGGEIGLDDEGVDGGTVIRIRLPQGETASR